MEQRFEIAKVVQEARTVIHSRQAGAVLSEGVVQEFEDKLARHGQDCGASHSLIFSCTNVSDVNKTDNLGVHIRLRSDAG